MKIRTRVPASWTAVSPTHNGEYRETRPLNQHGDDVGKPAPYEEPGAHHQRQLNEVLARVRRRAAAKNVERQHFARDREGEEDEVRKERGPDEPRRLRVEPALRVTVSKRLYRGSMDLPKSNKVRVIALTPPARDALLALPEREGPVFLSKAGGRLCAPLLSSYWREVQRRQRACDSTGTWRASTSASTT